MPDDEGVCSLQILGKLSDPLLCLRDVVPPEILRSWIQQGSCCWYGVVGDVNHWEL